MGWSFRKSKKIGPFRISVGKRGISTSVGVKGARVGVSSRGVRASASAGGVSAQHTFGAGSSPAASAPGSNDVAKAIVGVSVLALAGFCLFCGFVGLFGRRPEPMRVAAAPIYVDAGYDSGVDAGQHRRRHRVHR